MTKEASRPFDPFELAAALLLGLGAVTTAIAGYQSGLWGGASIEGYGEASALTTEASATFNDALLSYVQDTQTDVRAKELLWEAGGSNDAEHATRLREKASWLYAAHLSEHAYQVMGLPVREVAAGTGRAVGILPVDALEKALDVHLGDDYAKVLFAPSSAAFAAAKARFVSAREASITSDRFALASVILTISLFFAGLALVFKTKVRWGFLGSGGVVLVVGLAYMATLTWA